MDSAQNKASEPRRRREPGQTAGLRGRQEPEAHQAGLLLARSRQVGHPTRAQAGGTLVLWQHHREDQAPCPAPACPVEMALTPHPSTMLMGDLKAVQSLFKTLQAKHPPPRPNSSIADNWTMKVPPVPILPCQLCIRRKPLSTRGSFQLNNGRLITARPALS